MGIVNALNNRPVVVVGILVALHTIAYGIGYVTLDPGFLGTVLYPVVATVITPPFFGILCLIIGSGAVLSWISNKPKPISIFTGLQSILWLFVAFVYFINGFIMLGFAIGASWTLLSGYMGYVYANQIYTRYDTD